MVFPQMARIDKVRYFLGTFAYPKKNGSTQGDFFTIEPLAIENPRSIAIFGGKIQYDPGPVALNLRRI